MPSVYREKECSYCGKTHRGRGEQYCSSQCQNDSQRMDKVKLWLEGKHSGIRGTNQTATWIKWYLINKRGNKCEICSWSQTNPHTGKVPIELEHKDGDFSNNSIDNLQLICPNCHSLTATYKSLNKGKGRPR